MSIFGWLFGHVTQPVDTGQTVRDWIVGQTAAALEITEVGAFATPQGQLVLLDPLVLAQSPEWIDVPVRGGHIVVFHDVQEGRNSKLAVIFSDDTVAGGADTGTLAVDAGLASVFTPDSYRNITTFFDTFDSGRDPYNDFFSTYDDPDGGERKIVPLPDGTPVPYIHSGWGDGAYPVNSLTNMAGDVIAVYVDFMGKNDAGDWLLPPGLDN